MILVRNVFQCKYGRGDELVGLFKEAHDRWLKAFPEMKLRLLTDLSGPFFTVVTEMEVESLAAYEALLPQWFGDPEFEVWFGHTQELINTGRREYYTIVA